MRISAPLFLLVPLALLGCGAPGTDGDHAAGLSEQRLMLSQGYSLLYQDASKIDEVELILYVKIDSKEFNGLVTDVSHYAGEVKADLERIAQAYPGVRIDLEPLPEMEKRKRAAIGRDRMIRFAPLGGHSREEFERTLLISLSNGLNHESHLCRVMAQEEPDADLKKFLLASEQRYAALYERAVAMLEREYFRRR